jgi:hypothetical protein
MAGGTSVFGPWETPAPPLVGDYPIEKTSLIPGIPNGLTYGIAAFITAILVVPILLSKGR